MFNASGWCSWHLLTKIITCPSSLWIRVPKGTLDSFMWGSYAASLRNVGGSTQVPLWVHPDLSPPVKLESRHISICVMHIYFLLYLKSNFDILCVLKKNLLHFISAGLGLPDRVGHADFYPNGGFDQPGCKKPGAGGIYWHHSRKPYSVSCFDEFSLPHLLQRNISIQLPFSISRLLKVEKVTVWAFLSAKYFPGVNWLLKLLKP